MKLQILLRCACITVGLMLSRSVLAQSGFLGGGGTFGGAGAGSSWGEPTEYLGDRDQNGLPYELPQESNLEVGLYAYGGATALGAGFGSAVDAGALAYAPEVADFLAGTFTFVTGDASINIGVEAITYWGLTVESWETVMGVASMLLANDNGDQLLTPEGESYWALYEPGCEGYYQYDDGYRSYGP